jgi:aminoglycoside phosphotransferase (APT) family kinase protein
MENSPNNRKESDLKLKIEELLGKEVVELALQGKGLCNNAYFVQTSEGTKYIVKEERNDKEFQPQNDLVVEARTVKQLHTLDLSVPVPRVVFISENPKMYGYEYIEGDMLRNLWSSLQEDERINICHTLGHFHAEIGRNFTKEMAEASGIQVNRSVGLHPEVAKDYDEVLASTDVPGQFKILAKEAKLIFDSTADEAVFQFIHNDSHHENILIKDKKISGIIDFGESEYGEIAKEFSRYIRDFPDHFPYIVSAYEEISGNRLSYKRLVTNAFLSGLIDIVENYRKAGEDRVKAEKSIITYRKLIDALDK